MIVGGRDINFKTMLKDVEQLCLFVVTAGNYLSVI